MWTEFFYAVIACLCVLCAAVSLYGASRAYRALESLAAKLTSTESRVQSIITSHESWQELVTELARSVKMAKVRRGISENGSKGGEPDPKADPEAWRAWKNASLRPGEFNS